MILCAIISSLCMTIAIVEYSLNKRNESDLIREARAEWGEKLITSAKKFNRGKVSFPTFVVIKLNLSN